MSYISEDELIFEKKDNKIISCGFNIDIKNEEPFIINNNEVMEGGKKKISSIFENLAVPVGLFYKKKSNLKKIINSEYFDEENPKEKNVLDETIHEKLLKKIELKNQVSNNKRKTKGKKLIKGKKSKKLN